MTLLRDPAITPFLRTVLQGQFIGNEGDELPIGGLFIGLGYIAAEGLIQRFDAAATPGNFDGVTDGALLLIGTGAETPGDSGVEFFGDAADHCGLFDDQLDSFPEKLISLDMGGDAHGEEG